MSKIGHDITGHKAVVVKDIQKTLAKPSVKKARNVILEFMSEEIPKRPHYKEPWIEKEKLMKRLRQEFGLHTIRVALISLIAEGVIYTPTNNHYALSHIYGNLYGTNILHTR